MKQGAILALVPTQFLPDTVGILYTATSGTPNAVVVIHSFIIANTDSAAHVFTLYNVPKGGTPSAGNSIFAGVSIPANTTWVGRYEEGCLVVPAGGTVQGFSDSAGVVTITMGGREYS